MIGLVLLVLALVCALALGACGEDEVDRAVPPDVSRDVRDIADETKPLQQQIADAARDVVRDEPARERAAEELERLEGRARQLADRAEREISEADPARDSLQQANDRLAEAARDLREFAERQDDARLEEARRELARAQDQLDEASQSLAERLGEDGRDLIDRLQREIPEIPRR